MAAIFRLLVLAPIAVVVVLLSIGNRAPVQLSFDPLGGDAYTVTLPLFAVLLGAVMLGILVGGVSTWLGQGKYRRAARDAAKEARTAQAEVERLRAQLPLSATVGGTIATLPATMNR